MAKKKKDTRTKIYRVLLIDDNTHENIAIYKVPKNKFIITVASIIVCFILFIFCLIAFTPLRGLIPGYPAGNAHRLAIQNAIKVDSLEHLIKTWDIYSENISRIIDGKKTINVDSILNLKGRQFLSDEEIKSLNKKDSILRKRLREEEKFNINTKNNRKLPIEGLCFFTPLKGVISQEYNKAQHPFIDITAPKNSLVMSVLDGTVIYTGWSNDTGYTIHIQHQDNIISIYKHNSKILKKIGDKVTAGTAIALVGNTGSLSTGTHLHFELWYKGESVNPTKYINF